MLFLTSCGSYLHSKLSEMVQQAIANIFSGGWRIFIPLIEFPDCLQFQYHIRFHKSSADYNHILIKLLTKLDVGTQLQILFPHYLKKNNQNKNDQIICHFAFDLFVERYLWPYVQCYLHNIYKFRLNAVTKSITFDSKPVGYTFSSVQ